MYEFHFWIIPPVTEVFIFCKQKESLVPVFFTLLRVVVGLIMAVHGYGKLTNMAEIMGGFRNMVIPYPEISTYLAIAGEFLGGLGLMVGLLTPIAAFGVACVMAVAVFFVHFPNGLLTKNNGFEYPLTLLCVALYFLIHGGGKYSLDALCCKKK